MKIKTDTLADRALDYATALAEGLKPVWHRNYRLADMKETT